MIDATVQSLPVPLLLLIHLQVLQFPKINNVEFDLYVFDAKRRELHARVKTMEELGYWLVGRIERAGVKKVTLSTVRADGLLIIRSDSTNLPMPKASRDNCFSNIVFQVSRNPETECYQRQYSSFCMVERHTS